MGADAQFVWGLFVPAIRRSAAEFDDVNVAGRDWRRLAAYHAQVLTCLPGPPGRDSRGEAPEATTRIGAGRLAGSPAR